MSSASAFAIQVVSVLTGLPLGWSVRAGALALGACPPSPWLRRSGGLERSALERRSFMLRAEARNREAAVVTLKLNCVLISVRSNPLPHCGTGAVPTPNRLIDGVDAVAVGVSTSVRSARLTMRVISSALSIRSNNVLHPLSSSMSASSNRCTGNATSPMSTSQR